MTDVQLEPTHVGNGFGFGQEWETVPTQIALTRGPASKPTRFEDFRSLKVVLSVLDAERSEATTGARQAEAEWGRISFCSVGRKQRWHDSRGGKQRPRGCWPPRLF